MHELSLAQGLITQLLDIVREHDAGLVVTVFVEVGEQSGIVIDSFEFGFDAIKQEHEQIQGAELKITAADGIDLILLRVEME